MYVYKKERIYIWVLKLIFLVRIPTVEFQVYDVRNLKFQTEFLAINSKEFDG